MKNKLLTVLCAIALCICCALALTACQEEKQTYTVTYEACGGVMAEEEKQQSAQEGTFLEQPTAPTRTGYEFAGWAKDENGSQLWVFAVDKLSSDVTLYAVWSQIYTVTFDAGSGAFANDSRTDTVKASENSAIKEPTAPVREGYVLSGWTTDTRGLRVWDFKIDKVNADITLYAVWAKEQTIIFNANGGSFSQPSGNALLAEVDTEEEDETKTVTVARGFKIEEPATPYLSGYLFKGWYTAKVGGNKWDFNNDTVTNDLTLYAHWEEKVDDYEVTYCLNYDGAEDVVLQTENGYATYEPEERKGYIFNGWWFGSKSGDKVTLTDRYDETSRITKITTLYADWIDVSKIISKLASPTVSKEGSVFSWNEVEGATGYIVRVSVGSSYSSTTVKTYKTSSTSWTFPSDSAYEKGITYYVSVKAVGNGINKVSSGYSSGSSYTYRMLAGTTITMDFTTNVVSWTEVPNASTYELSIDGEVIRTSSSTSYDMSEYQAGSHIVSVVAKGSASYVNSTSTQNVIKYKLLKPEVTYGVKVSDNSYQLMWDDVSNADSYKITIGGKTVTVKTNSYTISDFTAWGNNDETKVVVYAYNTESDFVQSEGCELTLKKLVKFSLSGGSVRGTLYNVPLDDSYALNFDVNGGTGDIPSQTISKTNKIVYPSVAPTRSGYIFKGWYEDKECTTLYDFTKDISSDTTVYAGWKAINNSINKRVSVSENYNSSTAFSGYAGSNNYEFSIQKTSTSATSAVSYNIRLYYRLYSSRNVSIIIWEINDDGESKSIKSANTSSTSYAFMTFSVQAGKTYIVQVLNASGSSGSTTFYGYFTNAGNTGRYDNTPAAGGSLNNIYYKAATGTSSASTQVTEAGTKITLTAETVSGKTFDGWYVDGVRVSTEKTFTYTVKAKDKVITAKYI